MSRIVTYLVLSTAMFASSVAHSQISTSEKCAGIAASGGTVNTKCTFNLGYEKPDQRGKLVIQKAWLIPSGGFMAPEENEGRNEQAELTTVVRNLSGEDLVLDAARLQIIGSSALKVQGGIVSKDVLKDTIGDTNPIVVKAGRTANVTFGDTIVLPGIIRAIEMNDNLDAATLVPAMSPPRVNGDEYVNRFSQLMSDLYGKNTIIRVTFFTRDYQTVASINIHIDKGTDLFYDGEEFDRKTARHTFRPLLAYDAFLGQYLKQKEVWIPGFKIREAPRSCIDVIPDASVPGGWRYKAGRCGNNDSSPPDSSLTPTNTQTTSADHAASVAH